MRVNQVQTNCYNNRPNFRKLEITEEGATFLKTNLTPSEMEQVTKWGRELEDTRFFDLEIDTTMGREFLKLRSKITPQFDSEGPLFASRDCKGNKFNTYGRDLLDCGDWFSYDLEFPTEQEAQKAYDKLLHFESKCTPYTAGSIMDKIEWAVESTKILEKASEYAGAKSIRWRTEMPQSTTIISKKPAVTQEPEITKGPAKSSFTQRLKNAWQALKGN